MTIRNLQYALHPTSLAVIGASPREGSVGHVVMNNILGAGFEGPVWPVNPKYRDVLGQPCFRRIADLPVPPDLGIIITPPTTVPGIVGELCDKGTRAAVVITAGLTRENGLRQAMLDAAKPHLFRIIGPNTLGLMVPPAKLNAGFAHMAANPGGLALLSQSGAIATSLIDWAADKQIGFSHIVSLGDMADVDVGDYLDLLAGDRHTRAILLYLESIPNPRKFMSAARAAARIKPVIAIKAGRHEEAAKAAATHTGALSGADRVADAALSRAGILRVDGLAELFHAAETIARFPMLTQSRVGIVTNGGGAGVLAVDQLIDWGGDLATLSQDTIAKLDKSLPPTWSKANPVDIIGDAPAERYRAAVEAVAADSATDVLLVMNCPTGLASPTDAAAGVASLVKSGTIAGKPVLACWLGEHKAREARRILQQAGVASYETPAEAATAVSYLTGWSRAQKALMRVPSSRREDIRGRREDAEAVFRHAAGEGRHILTEPEAKAVLAAYGIPVPETIVARSPNEVGKVAGKLLKKHPNLVVKLLSKTITHKSDVGGVVLDLQTTEAAEQAALEIERRVRKAASADVIDGYAVQPMISRKHAQELILGVNPDPIFGPVVLFGAGGIAVEMVDDTAIALPPLDDVLAGDLIDRTRIGRLLAGFRGRPPADRAAITCALNAISQMIIDLPCITSMDVNPLLVDENGAIALDARIEFDPSRVDEIGPNPAFAIRPYPVGWDKDIETSQGEPYFIRPIKPVDVELYPPFLQKISSEDVRLRFLAPRKVFSEEMLLRMTQLDYDRDIAFIALARDSGELGGAAHLSSDPDRETAEFGILVRTDLQGHGLGWALLRQLIDYAKADGLGRIDGFILRENTKMLAMCRELGFDLKLHPDDPSLTMATLDLAR